MELEESKQHSAREISVNMGEADPESESLLTKITQLQDIIGADEQVFRLDVCKLDQRETKKSS